MERGCRRTRRLASGPSFHALRAASRGSGIVGIRRDATSVRRRDGVDRLTPMEGETARHPGDVGTSPEDERERDVVAGRVVGGGVPLPARAGVLAEVDVPRPVVDVLDGPVAAVPLEQLPRRAPTLRNRGDATGVPRLPFLLRVGPVELALDAEDPRDMRMVGHAP